MKYHYDLHIHSALSPCAENEMTPVTIVGQAKLLGLDFVAIADHNAIGHIEVAMRAGEAYGIKVIPAFELQTSEDIHILCLFETLENLKKFYKSINFSGIANRKDIFGEQFIYDEDDNIIGEELRMLLHSAEISSDEVPTLIKQFDGIAIPAHIDREMNGMLQILGTITNGYNCVELSTMVTDDVISKWSKTHNIVVNSDAHVLEDISTKGVIDLENYSVKALIEKLRERKI